MEEQQMERKHKERAHHLTPRILWIAGQAGDVVVGEDFPSLMGRVPLTVSICCAAKNSARFS